MSATAALTAGAPVAVTLPDRPYPGLRPFQQEEWSIFYGREQMIDEVIDRLARSRLVLIHGTSGSGKSSLVRAGVLPKLALQYTRHNAPWLTCDILPSGGPLWNLAAEFARLGGRAGDSECVSAIAGQFNARSATLSSVAASLEALRGKSLCVLVDQFEEVFRYAEKTSRDEAELFVDLVQRASAEECGKPASGVDLHVIVTMRSEFLGECARFTGFAETINRTQYLVPRMNDDALMRAVRRPAEMFGGVFDVALAERLVAAVLRHEDELSLLQHGLALMWNEARRARPNAPVMVDGGVVDDAGGLANLLSDHADAVMGSVTPNERSKQIVEAVFRALTDVNAQGAAIRRPCAFNHLCAVAGTTPEELRPILDAFRAPGVSFLTPYAPEPIGEKRAVDISHEALIRCWRKIGPGANAWLLREFRDGLVWRTLLFQAEDFAEDGSSFLSEATTEARAAWLTERNEAWSGRYGGGWPKVGALVEASRQHWKRVREASLEVQKRIADAEEQRKAVAVQRRIADAERQAREAAEEAGRQAKARADAESQAREAADEAARQAKARAEAEGRAREAADEAARQAGARAEAERQAREAAEQIAEEQKKAVIAGRRTAQVALVGLVVSLLVATTAILQYFKATEATRLATEATARAEASADQAKANFDKVQIAQVAAEQAKKDALMQRDDAFKAQLAAREAKVEAQASGDQANANLREAQITQSRYLAFLAGQRLTADGDAGTAGLLALAALPDPAAGIARPYVPQAELQLNDAWRDLRERFILGYDAGVNRSAFSPDGKRVVTASDDKTARLWDAATGHPIGEPLRGHDGAVWSAAFGPDGKRIVTASEDRTARIWDAENGLPIGEPLRGHDGAVYSAAFSPDGKRIVTASEDKTAHIWDSATDKPVGKPLRGHAGAVYSAAFSPDGKRIVTASEDKTARIWDAATGNPIGERLGGHDGPLWSAAFSPDGKRIVTASQDKTARIWDAATGLPIGEPLAGHDGAVFTAAFSPSGKRVVTASEDKTARIWDAETDQSVGEPLGGHFGPVRSAAFGPDGTRIVTASQDKTARIWNAETGEVGFLLHGGPVGSAAFSSDGKRIVTASEDKTARVWDAATGQPISEPLKGHEGPVGSAAFSPDGERIVTASKDKTARVWDAATGQPISELKGHEGSVNSAAFSPDGKRIVTGSSDKTARVWDAETGQPIGDPLKGHEGSVNGVAFSPDGKRIVTASSDKTARVWDAATGQPIGGPLKGHDDSVTSAAFSPDGKRIVTASSDNTARIWDAETGQPIGEPLKGHEGPVHSAVFSPDGKRIVTASDDKTARVWDAATGQPISELKGHDDSVTSAAFSPDGKHIVTASRDNTARVWDVFADTSEALVSQLKAIVPRCLTAAQRQAFYLPVEPPPWCIEMEKWPYNGPAWKQWLSEKRAGNNPPLPAPP